MRMDPVDWDGYTVYEEFFRLEASAEQSRKDARVEFDQLVEVGHVCIDVAARVLKACMA